MVREIKRRRLLKGLGLLSASTLTGLLGCKAEQKQSEKKDVATRKAPAAKCGIIDSSPRLNVVLHGMFAVVLDTRAKQANILAPDIPDHVYLAATATVDSSGDVAWKDVGRINSQSTLHVAGCSSSMLYSAPQPDKPPKDRVLINRALSKITRPGSTPYCTISLPWPSDIWPLRADTSSRLSGETYDANHLSLIQIPTVYVLTYALNAGNSPTFDISGTPQLIPRGNDGVFRLHLFAESPTGGDTLNPDMAVIELGKLFHNSSGSPAVKFHFKSVGPDAVDIDDPTCHSSVASCEERSIGELGIPCSRISTVTASAQGGGHPRNCMSVIIVSP